MQHVIEGAGVPGHLQPHVKAVQPHFAHPITDGLAADIHHLISAHVLSQLQPVVIHIGNDHMARTHVSADASGDDADGSGSRDQHVFAHQVELQRAMCGVAKGVEKSRQFRCDLIGNRP